MSEDRRIETALACQAVLGESPVWSEQRKRLLWVDTLSQELHAYDPVTGRDEVQEVPDVIGFVAENGDGVLTLALGCDLARMDASGRFERFATAPDGGPDYRLNDGKFDANGRLWTGLMANDLKEGSGVLYRYDPDGSWHRADEGFTLVNGLDWNPRGDTLYVTESRPGAIYVYDFDAASGAISGKRTLLTIDPEVGKPDGLAVDSDGSLLSVLFDGSAILRIAAEGTIERRISLPMPRPTSCAFSGDGRHLYVTSARLDLDEEQIAAAPLSGGLVRIEAALVRERRTTSA
jgi:sugar lactone lactonase YvrE